MMKSLLQVILPAIVMIGLYGILIVFVKLYNYSKRGKRSPLTKQLLRSPGESLRNQIEDVSLDISSLIAVFLFLPFYFYWSILQNAVITGATKNALILLFLAAGMLTMYMLWETFSRRSNLRLALDCELAVGQELNQLMLQGCHVYHDFPAEKFNIDHVVVSPQGVLAVETKGRAKPNKKRGTAEATVVYDGNGLKFPGWFEKEPIEQAKRQAKWLSSWLSSSVGDSVVVHSVLVLPGWYIEREKPADIVIFNGKNPELLLKWINDEKLSESMITRINHQIEQKCRDVEPLAYGQDKKN
jgi:hypothetical protein